MSMIKYCLTWIAVSYYKWDEFIEYFLNLFIGWLIILEYVMTDWFNFRLQTITHKSVERQVIKSLKKIEIVWL